MTPYLLLEIAALALVSLGRTGKPLLQKTGFVLAAAAMVLFAGFRSVAVGTDSFNYVLKFSKVFDLNDVLEDQVEPGYGFLCLIGKAVADNYWTVFTLAALITVACYFWVIKKYSAQPTISLFIYITGGAYTFLFNGARQALALAIVFLGVGAILKRKFLALALFVGAAFFFHRTALVLLPAYFIIIQKDARKTYVAVGVFMILLFLNFSTVIRWTELIDERYGAYSTYERGLGAGITLLNMGLFALLAALKRQIVHHRQDYIILLNMYLIGISISMVSLLRGLGASGVMRLSFYFSCALILLWPIVFVNLVHQKERMMASYAFLLLYTLYFMYTTQRFGQLVPYEINPFFA